MDSPSQRFVELRNYAPVRRQVSSTPKQREIELSLYPRSTGGWLVTEPFIVPALYEPYEDDAVAAIDEYASMPKYDNNATARMREHYESSITEKDFAAMAGAGLNCVRIPLWFWAVETIEGEPFVEGLSWQYFVE